MRNLNRVQLRYRRFLATVTRSQSIDFRTASRTAQASTDRFHVTMTRGKGEMQCVSRDFEGEILGCLSCSKGTTKVQPPTYRLLFRHLDKAFKARRSPRMRASFLARDQRLT